MTIIQGTATIRDRGQLTIPDKIREALKWPAPNSVVSLSITLRNEILIKPYEIQKKVDWAQIWINIEASRSYRGKRGNLSNFISFDRKNH